MDNIVKLLKENKYSQLKDKVENIMSEKITNRINSKKEELLNKLRGK